MFNLYDNCSIVVFENWRCLRTDDKEHNLKLLVKWDKKLSMKLCRYSTFRSSVHDNGYVYLMIFFIEMLNLTHANEMMFLLPYSEKQGLNSPTKKLMHTINTIIFRKPE